jgi:hypothetical protein
MEVGYKHLFIFLALDNCHGYSYIFCFRKNVVVHLSNLSVMKELPVFQCSRIGMKVLRYQEIMQRTGAPN